MSRWSDDYLECGGQKERFDTHINQTTDGTGRAVCMEGRVNKVTGERRLDGDSCSFNISNLTDENNVRILSKNCSQARGEGQSNICININLDESRHFVFDWIFGGDEFFFGIQSLHDGGVERGGFSATGRTRDENDSVWSFHRYGGIDRGQTLSYRSDRYRPSSFLCREYASRAIRRELSAGSRHGGRLLFPGG